MCSIYLDIIAQNLARHSKTAVRKLKREVRVELHLGYGKSAALDCKFPAIKRLQQVRDRMRKEPVRNDCG